ncbi:MAG: hypothetical protein K2N23_00250, partial [Clostridia bacterium]|nr:hypothetical protein [Clostridia bacterium]
MDNRKRLREYLKGYRMWQAQARDIERALSGGEVLESLRGLLANSKSEFIGKCHNVQIILGYAKSDLERRILHMLYISGKSMKHVARELGYSYGYCANIELKAISRMSIDVEIMRL